MSIARRGFRIFGKLVKAAFVVLIIAINVFWLWRVFSSSDPKSMDTLVPNEALIEAYDADNTLSGMFYQEQRSVTSAEHNYGYFAVTRSVVIPDANQLQLVFRYNNSTIRALQKDYGLENVPSREEELYDVTLVVATDLTPENKEDNLSSDPSCVSMTRIHGQLAATDQKNLYNYRKFVFDFGELDIKNLKESGTLIAIYADVYYKGDVNYDETPYGTLCLYDYLTDTVAADISSADIEAIEEWKERNLGG